MDKVLQKQLNQLEKLEHDFLQLKENPMVKAKVAPVMDKIQSIIPEKLKTTLDTAFYKGFQLVFEKGNAIIEKTYNKEKLQLEHDINNYALNKKLSAKYMKKLDKTSKYSNVLNTSFSIVEGGLLGALGIGIPDIPLFISIIIKNIYEIALSYGFNYETTEEKAYILMLIRYALADSEKKSQLKVDLDRLGDNIDHNISTEISLDEQMKASSNALSEALLTAKFIQGIPIVGAVGGIVNYTIIQKIGHCSKIKYKKRYLLKKLESMEKAN
jgi:hypothetical protein